MNTSISAVKGIEGRYITLSTVRKALEKFPYTTIGHSVQQRPIMLFRLGTGRRKILMWSQMHGNESTTTKSVIDLIHHLSENDSLLAECSLFIIPILNPDGAEIYTRTNASGVDLNRDALHLSQPETQALFRSYENIQPDFCFNLHDQRTLFSLGNPPYPATISFLAPAENPERSLTPTRKKSMEVIAAVFEQMKAILPHQIGRFSDEFNIHCTGDRFTQLGVPTILFEAGHFPGDYQREITRKLVAQALLETISYISKKNVSGENYKAYFEIPENQKQFLDLIIEDDITEKKQHLGIIFIEKLNKKNIIFEPFIQQEGSLNGFFAHQYRKLSEFINSEGAIPHFKKYLTSIDFISAQKNKK